jgi:ribosome maturation factor RimP
VGQSVPLFCFTKAKPLNSLELEEKVRTLAEAAGLRLLQALWKPLRGGRQMLRVIADAEDHNITIEECAGLSRSLSDLLDSYPHEFPDYRLEVSSPGLGHPLENWQIPKNVGRRVEVQYQEEETVRSCVGEMIAADTSGVTVTSREETRTFLLENIRQIIVIPKF